jgi:hypothetical protein
MLINCYSICAEIFKRGLLIEALFKKPVFSEATFFFSTPLLTVIFPVPSPVFRLIDNIRRLYY